MRTYTMLRAAELLGLDSDVAVRLVRLGVLKAGPLRKGVRLVTWEALAACAQHRLYWLVLHTTGRRPTSPMLAEYVRRGRAQGRWWGAADIAEACGISATTVSWRRGRGWGGDGWQRWGPHWYWWGQEPPAWPMRELSGVAYREMRERLGSWQAVADAVGKSPQAVRLAVYYAERRRA